MVEFTSNKQIENFRNWFGFLVDVIEFWISFARRGWCADWVFHFSFPVWNQIIIMRIFLLQVSNYYWMDANASSCSFLLERFYFYNSHYLYLRSTRTSKVNRRIEVAADQEHQNEQHLLFLDTPRSNFLILFHQCTLQLHTSKNSTSHSAEEIRTRGNQ